MKRGSVVDLEHRVLAAVRKWRRLHLSGRVCKTAEERDRLHVQIDRAHDELGAVADQLEQAVIAHRIRVSLINAEGSKRRAAALKGLATRRAKAAVK